MIKRLCQLIREQPIYIIKLVSKIISPYLVRKPMNFIFKSKQLGIKWSARAFPDLLTRHMLFFGFYQEDVLLALKNLLKKDDVMLDIGAHHGLMAIIASRAVGQKGKVISFEPNPYARVYFKDNLKLNNVKNAKIEPIGLMDKKGLLKFFPQKGRVSWNSSFFEQFVLPNKKVTPVLVKVMTLDEYVKKFSIIPNLLKIDVEGAEFLVLKGGKKTISRYHPIIIMEFNELSAKKAGVSISQITNLLKRRGYCFYTFGKGSWWWLSGRYKLKNLLTCEPGKKRKDLYNVICLPIDLRNLDFIKN